MSDERVANAAEFRKQLGVLRRASCRAVLVRTREPFRAESVIRDFTAAEPGELIFKSWNQLLGWSTSPSDVEQPDTYDGMFEPVAAIKAIDAVGTQSGQPFPNGVYVMTYAHQMMGKAMPMILCIKKYAQDFSENYGRMLILITPPNFELPAELEDDLTILDFDTPSAIELQAIFEDLLEGLQLTNPALRPSFSQAETDRVLSAGAGMTAQEFEAAAARAVVTLRHEKPVTIDSLVKVVMDCKVDMVKRSDVLELIPVEDMENVGGLGSLKAWVAERALCFGAEARAAGVDIPRGCAIIGVPGAGKSMFAKAIAHTVQKPLIRFDISRIFKGIVGSSEATARAALKMIENMAPCIVLADEIDKAGLSPTGGSDSGVGTRILGMILTMMQESNKGVFWVFTANRVRGLPSEFLRRGRLDEVWSVLAPGPSDRMEIIKIHLRKRLQDPDEIEDLMDAVDGSEGYVGAELESCVSEAVLKSFTTGVPVTGALILQQLGNMVPLSVAFAEDFNAMGQWAANNARSSSEDDGVQRRATPVVRTRSRGQRKVAVGGLD